MKSLQDAAGAPAIDEAATIVRLADVPAGDDALQARSAAGDAQGRAVLQHARAFAEPLLDGAQLDTGEDALAHADGVAGVLRAIGAYLQQVGSAFSTDYIDQALIANPALAAGLVRLFEAVVADYDTGQAGRLFEGTGIV